MADFKKGDRVKVAEDATIANGFTSRALSEIRGKEALVTKPTPDIDGDVVICRGEGTIGRAHVDPKFLTLATDDVPVLVEVEDLSTLTVGQRVTLEAKSARARIAAEFLNDHENAFHARIAKDVSPHWFLKADWRVLVEKPRVELPTEDGIYLDSKGSLWSLREDEWGREGDGVLPAAERGLLAERAPFIRLVPEGSERNQAIRDVLDDLRLGGYRGAGQRIKATFRETLSDAG